MLFLRHLRHVELCRNGERVDQFNREDAGELCEITGTESRREWLVLKGDLGEEARSFFDSNPALGARRDSSVSLAVPLDEEVHGLLCAYLPTDESSRLPLHVNADFFPGSDRRRLLAEGPRGEWNRLALHAVAQALADHLELLASALSPTRLWQVIFAAHEAKEEATELGIDAYWAALGPVLPDATVMWTTASEWTSPSHAYLLGSPSEEGPVVPLLERLGVSIVHPDIAGHVRRMSGWAGAQEFTLAALTKALAAAESREQDNLAGLLSNAKERSALWEEAERLLARKKSSTDLDAFRSVRIWPGMDGSLWAARELLRADTSAAELAEVIGLPLQFLDAAALPADAARLGWLCDLLDVRFMLTLLSSDDGMQKLSDALASGRLEAAKLLIWLASQEKEIDEWNQADLIAALPIFPTPSGHYVLADAPLPGGFIDRLGIADAIDTAQIGGCEEFLKRLGAKKLTRKHYLIDFLPLAAEDSDIVASSDWHHLVLDLARDLDGIAADAQVRAALLPLPLVPVTFHEEELMAPAADAYFGTREVRDVFGDDVRLAKLIPGHETVADALFRWLGVSDTPRLEDLVSHVRALADKPPTATARNRATGIIRYLGTLVHDRRTSLPASAEPLRELAWLPTERDQVRWYPPSEVQTTARRYLFATQGTFLAAPQEVQQSAADFLYWLGVTANPTIAQVVAHLLTCAEQGQPVNQQVFVELSTHPDDPAIRRLAGKKCLLLDDGTYVSPENVFRDENPFGRFREQLGPQWDEVSPLLERLGIKKRPDPDDAVRVLIDVAADLAAYHSPVEDPDDLTVIWHCWSMLDNALETELPDQFAALREHPVIPNKDLVLTAPTRLVIDDMPGVADALHLGASVLERKEGMWRAFEKAGVRSLSAAVRIEVVNRHPAERPGMVAACINERKRALARVLDEQSPGDRRLDLLLSALAIHETSSLTVRYELPAFGRTSDQIDVAAIYLPAADESAPELLVCTAGSRQPWMAVARELARALDPDHAPGLLAPTLFVVLNAPTLQEAHAYLDEAGLPRLDTEKISEPTARPAAGLGGEVSFDDTAQAEDSADGPPANAQPTEGTQHSQAGETATSDSAGGPREAEGTADTKGRVSGAAADAYDGEGYEREPAGASEAIGGRTSDTSSPGNGERSSQRKPARRSRLRSYVLPGSDAENSETKERSPVDDAGIRRVVAVEKSQGRFPEVQSHNNPGFDIVSSSSTGELLRHIEVKSTDGLWDEMGVGLSPRQLGFAEDHPETFWLYVVEYATDDQRARVFGIPDAASKIEEYRFDSGWAAIAEHMSSQPPTPADVVYAPERPGASWLPFRRLDQLDASTSPGAWIPWDGSPTETDVFAVQVLGRALEPGIPRGSLVIVEPVRQPAPHDLVVAELADAWDHDGQAAATIRYWEPDTDPESGQLVDVTLAADESSDIEPMDVSPSMLRVVGRVMNTLRPAIKHD
jgi:hypothetical protein